MAQLRNRVSARWRSWINHRLPRQDQRHLDRKNLFILPTGAGVVFSLLLVVMLLTGINYQNSLIFLLTFLLGGLFVAAMHQTHNNLEGLDLSLMQPGEGFAGEDIPFRIRMQGRQDATGISLSCDTGTPISLSVRGNELVDGTLSIASRQRGYLLPDRIRVETRFPFGLLKAWSWLRPATPAVVYPRPMVPPQEPEAAGEGDSAEASHSISGQDQVELRPWRDGDLSARVDWKRFSRNGDMVVADWQGEKANPQWLDYDGFPGCDPELRLSYLTALVVQRHQASAPWGLRLPGQTIEPDQGDQHYRRCLRALAVWGLESPAKERAHGR